MPLHRVKNDITKIKCDAIVNAANNTLLGGGGVDGAIHKVAGVGLLEECKTLGGCETGDAKITKGYNLPCKYVIHTVGPIWQGGQKGEREKLESCYKKSLLIAKERGVETIAFPIISSGAYGYPKQDAMSVAVDTISRFLLLNEMTVYLVVFDKTAFKINDRLYLGVKRFIDDNYADGEVRPKMTAYKSFNRQIEPNFAQNDFSVSEDFCFEQSVVSKSLKPKISLVEMLANIDDTFAVTLLKLIDHKKMSEVKCYKMANVSKQTWYKIMNERDYKPSKNTVIAFAIALKLTLEETRRLLATVGFTLSKSSKFDIIIEYFLTIGEYDIFKINQTLFEFDQVCLGV